MKRFLRLLDLLILDFFLNPKALTAVVIGMFSLVLARWFVPSADFLGGSADILNFVFLFALGRRNQKTLPYWIALAVFSLAGISLMFAKTLIAPLIQIAAIFYMCFVGDNDDIDNLKRRRARLRRKQEEDKAKMAVFGGLV